MQRDGIRINTIDTTAGFREHRLLQNLVWTHDPPESVPAELLIALAHHGGIVLGAYASDTMVMVGVLLSVPALHERRLVHLSHLLGVHPGWRGQGIGEAMKWRQRELVLAMNIETIIWTFDPLEAVNARLNLTRLGGIVRSYERDYYGAMEDALNRGIPSDRMIVEWRLNSPRVRERLAGETLTPPDAPIPIALPAETAPHRLPRPGAFVAPAGPAALLEVPARIQEIKRQDLDLALAWRLAVRDAFERLIADGFAATEVVRRGARIFYVVEKATHED